MGREKQYWSVAETISLLKLWSSLRQHLDRATRTKESYEEIQRALAAQGHERELEQIVNKIKKLKIEFKEMNRSELDRNYWLKRNLYFDFLEKAFGRGGDVQAPESDEDAVSERSPADAEMHQTRPDAAAEDDQSHDHSLHIERPDPGQSQGRNAGGRSRSKQTGSEAIAEVREKSPQPGASATVKTELSEDISLISSCRKTAPCPKKYKYPPAPLGKRTVKVEPTDPTVQLSPERGLSSSDFKIEYVVTEDDFISFSAPHLRPVSKMNNDKWQDDEVQALLSLYATKKTHQEFASQRYNMRIFETISNELANIGIHHTTKQCREKVKKLKQDYKKIKEINESGVEFKKSKWFNILDSILGHHPQYSQSALDSAENFSTEPLESIFSEHGTERERTQVSVPESENSSIQLSIDPVLSSSGLKIGCVVSESGDCSSYPSFYTPRPELKMSDERWFDVEVKALLSLYATKEMERDSEGQTNTRIFEKISRDLANIGIHHSAKHCREKIKKLKQDYRKIKEHNNHFGAKIKTSKWYDILDSILGHLPAYSGSTGTTNNNISTERLESFCSGHSIDTTDDLDYLSKSAQIQPCLERLLGSTHGSFDTEDSSKPASLSQYPLSGNVTLESICAEHNTQTRECPEEPDAENPSLQLPFDPAFKTSNDKWHDAEVQAFLSIYASKKMQQDSDSLTPTKIFPGISRELAKIGIHRTARNCREKIKKLKQDYRRIKSHNESGAQFKKSKWFNILDGILGHEPVYAIASDNSSMEPPEESYGMSTESFGSMEQDRPSLDGHLGSTPAALACGSASKPASPASYCATGGVALGVNHIEDSAESEDGDESVSECEVDLSLMPHSLQCPESSAGTAPGRPAVRSPPFRFRPGKRKRQSSELVERLERMHEQYLQHSRDMHDALLNKVDAHMNTVIGLMRRMTAALEAQAAKQPAQQ